MKSTKILLTAALAVLMSAITAPAALPPVVTIASLPALITSPGTYVLATDLVCQIPNPAITGLCITIDLARSRQTGRVVLDFQGHAILASGGNNTAGILVLSNPTRSSITVKNGVLQGFFIGVDVNPTAGSVLNIHVENMQLVGTDTLAGVRFIRVNSSTISDCTFVGGQYGIRDEHTLGGNGFSNCTFDGSQTFPVAILTPDGPLELGHCQVQAPVQ